MADSEIDKLDHALEAVPESRRHFLRKVVATSAFVAPVVASFAIDGMMVSSAYGEPNQLTPLPNSSSSSQAS